MFGVRDKEIQRVRNIVQFEADQKAAEIYKKVQQLFEQLSANGNFRSGQRFSELMNLCTEQVNDFIKKRVAQISEYQIEQSLVFREKEWTDIENIISNSAIGITQVFNEHGKKSEDIITTYRIFLDAIPINARALTQHEIELVKRKKVWDIRQKKIVFIVSTITGIVGFILGLITKINWGK